MLYDVLRSNYRRIVLIKSIENVYYDVIKYLADLCRGPRTMERLRVVDKKDATPPVTILWHEHNSEQDTTTAAGPLYFWIIVVKPNRGRMVYGGAV